MKKIISMFLVVALCMYLCACGIREPQSSAGVESARNESSIREHPLLPYLLGEWEFESGEDATFHSIVINQDGSCVVDGVSYSWKIPDGYPSVDELFIDVYEGDTIICGVYLYNSVEGYTINSADADRMLCGGIYRKVS